MVIQLAQCHICTEYNVVIMFTGGLQILLVKIFDFENVILFNLYIGKDGEPLVHIYLIIDFHVFFIYSVKLLIKLLSFEIIVVYCIRLL